MTELTPFLPEEDLCPAMTGPHLWGRTADGKERECLWCMRRGPTILAGPEPQTTDLRIPDGCVPRPEKVIQIDDAEDRPGMNLTNKGLPSREHPDA